MKKSILNLGTVLTNKQQKQVQGGTCSSNLDCETFCNLSINRCAPHMF